MSKDLNFPFSAVLPKEAEQESELHQRQDMSAGLLRFRSAPSSLLGEACKDLFPSRSSGSGAMGCSTAFMVEGKEGAMMMECPSSSFTQLLFQSPHQQQHQQFSAVTTLSSTGVEQERRGGGGGSGLVRHSSSPAGLFTHLGNEKGFDSCKLKTQMSFSSRQGSSNFMSQVSEVGSEGLGEHISSEGSDNNRCYIPSYLVTSWEDGVLSESFSGAKRNRADQSEIQIGEMGNHGPSLAHHLSLPTTSSESEFIQFQDAVPWKLRAKRGYATHPRSIAERVRRTKISERMKKLQDLVPNMDKQTSTADMLELATEYIKELRREIKTLTDNRSSCTCCSWSSDGRR